MSINFKFQPTATIEHLNIRKEGADRDILAIDIKLSGDTEAGILASILGCKPTQARHFWNTNSADKPVAFNGISKIQAWTVFENCLVVIGDREFKNAKVRKFAFQPKKGLLLALECLVTLTSIGDAEIAYICDRIRDEVAVSISAQPDLFAVNEGEK